MTIPDALRARSEARWVPDVRPPEARRIGEGDERELKCRWMRGRSVRRGRVREWPCPPASIPSQGWDTRR